MSQPTRRPPSRGTAVWHGTGESRRGLTLLLWSGVRLLLAGWLWGTALRLARFSPPINQIGAALAVGALMLLVWSLWSAWRGLRHLGAQKALLLAVLAYLGLTVFNLLTLPGSQPWWSRLASQLVATGGQMAASLGRLAVALPRAPDDFLAAYSGEGGAPAPPPGFPTLDPRATPIRAVAVAAGRSPDPAAGSAGLVVGGYARVFNTGGRGLRARVGAGTGFDVVARFPEGTRLAILAGPESRDGLTWWRVRGDPGEGWCADQWLVPSD